MASPLSTMRDGFSRSYGKLSTPARVLVGAGLSAIVFMGVNGRVLKPQTERIARLDASLSALGTTGMNVAEVVKMRQDNTDRMRDLTRKLKEENAALARESGGLEHNGTGRTLAEFRRLLDTHSLRLVTEERLGDAAPAASAPAAPVRRQRSGTGAAAAPAALSRVPVPVRPGMKMESYRFVVLGRFTDILEFLRTAYTAKNVFFINNVSLRNSEEVIIDRNFQQYTARECAFEFHIPYLADGGAPRPGTGSKGKRP